MAAARGRCLLSWPGRSSDRNGRLNPCARRSRRGSSVRPWTDARALVLAALVGTQLSVHAVTLGGFEVQSSLGQRLRMVVQVIAAADEAIDLGCFKTNPYTIGSDGLPQLTNAQLSLDRRGGDTRLVVTSPRPVNDPIVRVSIDVGCNTTLRRDLTLLLDPPPVISNVPETAGAPAGPAAGGTGRQSGEATADTAAPGQAAGDPAKSATDAARADASPAAPITRRAPPPPVAPRARTAERTERSSATPREPREVARPPRGPLPPASRRSDSLSVPPGTPAAKAPSGAGQRDRLTISSSGPPLDSVSAPLTPRLTLSTTLSDRSRQAPLPDSVIGMLRQKQARLRAAPAEEDIPSLEAEIVVLQKKTAELRGQLEAMMAKMQSMTATAANAPAPPATAPSATPPNAAPPAATPVQSLPDATLSQRTWLDSRYLFGAALAALIALLIVALMVWIRRERAERRRQERWSDPAFAASTSAFASPTAPIPSPATIATAQPLAHADVNDDTAQPSIIDRFSVTSFGSGPPTQFGVSDLAQATEKASVFMTLGRPEQAIDVLREHIDHEPKPSPMAWLMLLDLYRQTRNPIEFSDVAERFHRTFNAERPQWELPNDGEDPGLVAFPRVIGQIRQLWPHPAAYDFIDDVLHDNRGGSRIGFSLAAFRDLLLLHSILEEYLVAMSARRDHHAGGAPIPEPEPPSHLSRIWYEAPAPEPAPRSGAPTLELDVSLLTDSPECSALEKGLPVVAEAIVSRWGKPGAADYVTNLIVLSKDDRNSDVSNEMLSDLLMLQEVATALEESGHVRDLSYR